MEVCIDFLNWLDPDISVQILMYLEDPSDLVHVSSVSRSWRDFVIANGLFKHLCLRMFPQLSRVARVMELNKCRAKKPVEVGSSYSMEWESLARDHRVYATLAQVCTSFIFEDCISEAISASSTDHYPDESIHNTLLPAYTWRASYWSSEGQSNPAVPETLIYKLKSEFCVITEINICPFQQHLSSLHIYSSNSVRFRMGHPKGPYDLGSRHLGDSLPCNADDTFIWTYTSPEFPMAQEGCLQNFRLPEPVLCIGGILQIELLGRVQRHEMDGLFYICMSYVQVVGCSLSPTFCVEILEPSGTFVLKNDMQGKSYTPPSLPKNEAQGNKYAVEFIDEYESGEEEDEAEVSEHVVTCDKTAHHCLFYIDGLMA
ncbi:F-box protein At4g00755 [Quercus suber]|uniref:F-box protein At4g00755 n=1 Tax=Quercus suber TaxID=58331 RepID=UPI000D286D34|nr:f-box protein [Quercus suber]